MKETASRTPSDGALGQEAIAGMAARVAHSIGTGEQIEPFCAGRGVSLRQAYAIAGEVARLRGGRPAGRKIGFTNRTIWPRYGVDAPMWGVMTDRTVAEAGPEAVPLAPLAEPRIEPEVALRLAEAPRPGMDERALLGVVEWFAPAFEIVHSVFPGWRFTLADSVAAGGLHGRLLLGPAVPAGPWAQSLPAVRLHLSRDGTEVETGEGTNVLGGPLSALRHLVETLAADGAPPLSAGEIVTTGTLTDAWPVRPGEHWQARFEGVPLADIEVRFA
jgi:2-oxo-3-hexenedioate decarboxylase